ncbi:hypothetical protein AQUCO_01000270v1 [Aquilegia coerulea]|uniref:Fibronectin type-III domain-containing protein n=1 Tax=Aquilegia coerulea TaxID=218851 RepID=A0A2G5E938_AQUCA|nr:hypothetical protein AQUCO_01000270v1 [Aquilegia coerulea]
MESDFSDFVFNRAKYSQLSMQEKRELVHEIARWSKNPPEILLAWPRQELADLISAESGMERKYSGVKKSWLIERLLKLISEGSENSNDDLIASSSGKTQIGSKRPRKKDYSVLFATDHSDNFSVESHENKNVDLMFCQNVACRATLAQQSKFCKRCSCCICYHYDDNKDPSLWLICGSDSLKQEDSCGMSCHLECALKNGRSGNVKNGFYTMLKGSFCCVSCGKVNGIMGSLRKQLLVAKDARRVDVLCQRISLSHTILKRTEEYKELQIIIDTMVKKLNAEVGPVEQVSSAMARGLVSRLSCGAEVQQLCASALDRLHSFLPNLCPDQTDNEGRPSCSIRFEQVSPVSVVVVLEYGEMLLLDFLGCRIWHRKSTAVEYPGKPTHIVVRPEKRFVISDLDPSTEYSFKVSVFSSSKELGQWESTCVTQAPTGSSFSGLDAEYGKDHPITGHANSQRDSTTSSDDKLACSDNHSKVRLLDDISKNEECHLPPRSTSSNGEPFTGSMFVPATPCKPDGTQEVPSSTAKKHSAESNYEYCVRVIRWLECEGYMEKDLRVKFLTWFSLKSSMRDRRVVCAFVDALIDDPHSLVDQLVDTFGDEISNEKKLTPRFAFCTKLWH